MPSKIGAVVLLLALGAASACVSPSDYRELDAANKVLRAQLDDLAQHQTALDEENAQLRDQVERLGRNAVDADFVRNQKEELARLIREFQAGGLPAVPGVTVIERPEGVGFELQGEVLFASGMAEITPSGQAVLAQLVPVLQRHGKHVRIDGHTDSDPIRHSAWKTNMRLAAERAMSVLAFFSSHGIDERMLHIAAHGEHRPAVPGDDADAKRKNRRVEILMLAE